MTRRILHIAVAAALTLAATTVHAQHGGGGAPGGSPGGGGNPGGSAGSLSGTNTTNHGYDSHAGSTANGFPNANIHGSLSLPTHGIHSMGLPGRWWDDSHTAKSLGLSTDQRKQMDQIFEASRPAIAARFASLLQEQKSMNDMPSKDLTDEAKVNAALDRVTEARAALERTTNGVLTQIRQTLSEGQQARLDDAIAKQK